MYNPQAARVRSGSASPPKTFAQLQAAVGPALKAKGIDLFADSGTSGWNILPVDLVRSAAASRTATYTKATGYLNSPKTVAAIQTCSSTSTRPGRCPA